MSYPKQTTNDSDRSFLVLTDRELLRIESIGFADARGTLDRNDELGFQRVHALAEAFEQLCMRQHRHRCGISQ